VNLGIVQLALKKYEESEASYFMALEHLDQIIQIVINLRISEYYVIVT